MKSYHFVTVVVLFLVLSFITGPFSLAQAISLAQARKQVAADKDKTYYVWCLYEKKLLHKNPYKLKKAEKKAEKHRKEMGHGTQLLGDKPEEF
ncbi:MAG TPA: hypothetical protein ENG78_04035 [Acidiferrobacteraceae bacterium]|nr:hypothetical protein [Acidiferrobacteraceae bacterium]HEX19972.1 hypothetical protein [Acidiferrobacteraceae bacterium]